MKILLVTPYFVPAWTFGGPVKLVYELAVRLQAQGHQVTVATTDALTAQRRHDKQMDTMSGVEVIYFRNLNNWLAARMNAYIPLGFSSWCKKHLAEYDVVHCHDLFTWLNVVISREAPKRNIPFLIQPHGALNAVRVKSRMSWLKNMYLSMFRSVLARASIIVTSTTGERDQEIGTIDPAYLKKTQVVTNGLDVSQLQMPDRQSPVRKEFGITNDQPMILYFGRLQYIKGLDISLRALALVKDIPWKYVIVGHDEQVVTELKTLAINLGIADRVFFVGSTFGARMKAILAAADLFLFNSRSEGLPMAVLDACAAGLPSILSADCHVPEVGEFGAGIVLEHNTPEQTAEALRKYFLHPEHIPAKQQQCHEVIRQVFNLDKVAQRYVSLYQQSVDAV